MRSRLAGFTLVELLITIVVIGILASISVVAYSGIQARAYNAAQLVETNNIVKALDFYIAKHNRLPPLPTYGDNAGYCVGTGYPNGRCRDSYWDPNSYPETDKSLTNAIATITNPPTNKRENVHGTSGPYVMAFWSTHLRVTGVFKAETCPHGLATGWNDPGSNRLLCFKDVTVPG